MNFIVKKTNYGTYSNKHECYLNILISQFINKNGDRIERIVSISSCHFGYSCSYLMALLCRTTGFLLEHSGYRAPPTSASGMSLLLPFRTHRQISVAYFIDFSSKCTNIIPL